MGELMDVIKIAEYIAQEYAGLNLSVESVIFTEPLTAVIVFQGGKKMKVVGKFATDLRSSPKPAQPKCQGEVYGLYCR